jgi:hypothetical protein
MRLFEIHLKNACTRVAKTFPLERLRAEAEYICDTLRAPYWDATESPVPPILTQPMVKVLAVDKGQVKTVEMRNPLTYYAFRVSYRLCNADQMAVRIALCLQYAVLVSGYNRRVEPVVSMF